MSLNIEEIIKNLQQTIGKEDHNEVYEYTKLLLKEFPDDEEYQQCFIISALKINLTDELQTLFKTSPSKQSIQKLYAYYLYNVGDYQKSIIFIQNLLKNSKNDKHIYSYKLLLAQTYFKINDPASSAKIMLELLQSRNLQQQDLEMYLVNLFATLINKQLDEGIVARYKNITKQTYCKQVYYNYGLLLISLEDYIGGIECLSIFQKSLKKGEDDNDIKMVTVLKDYISYKQSKENIHLMDIQTDKVRQYEKMEEEVKEVNLKNVLRNNLIFFKYQNNEHILQNFNQIIRVIDEGLDKKSKMTKSQQFILKMNKFTLLLRKNRLNDAAKLLKDLQSNFEPQIFLNDNTSFLKGKYSFLKKTKDSNKQGDIQKFLNSLQKHHKNLAFCLLADLKRQQNRQTELINELKEPHIPIIKNFIFSLLIKNPDLFEQYHEYLDQLLLKTNDIKILDMLLKLYDNKKDLNKQLQILNKILKINPKDIDNKVKMAEIYLNQGQMGKAEQLLRGVEQPQQINDINYLQNIEKNIHISIKKEQEITVGKKNVQIKENANKNSNHPEKKRIKKTRKPRLPKNTQNFIQGFKGDPQRWLPKWQRKGYKKKGKKGTGKTQGLATVGKEETKNIFTTNASTSSKQVTKQIQKKKK